MTENIIDSQSIVDALNAKMKKLDELIAKCQEASDKTNASIVDLHAKRGEVRGFIGQLQANVDKIND